MKKRNITKIIVSMSILVALAAVLSIVDRYISSTFLSAFPVVGLIFPYFKIGIANIIVLIIIYNYQFRYSIVAVILKSIIVALFSPTSLTTFIIGFSGTILSFFGMFFLKNISCKNTFMIFVSLVGGFMHSLGQILATLALYNMFATQTVLLYSPLILLIGIISGTIVGIITFKLNDLIKKHNLLKIQGDNKYE